MAYATVSNPQLAAASTTASRRLRGAGSCFVRRPAVGLLEQHRALWAAPRPKPTEHLGRPPEDVAQVAGSHEVEPGAQREPGDVRHEVPDPSRRAGVGCAAARLREQSFGRVDGEAGAVGEGARKVRRRGSEPGCEVQDGMRRARQRGQDRAGGVATVPEGGLRAVGAGGVRRLGARHVEQPRDLGRQALGCHCGRGPTPRMKLKLMCSDPVAVKARCRTPSGRSNQPPSWRRTVCRAPDEAR